MGYHIERLACKNGVYVFEISDQDTGEIKNAGIHKEALFALLTVAERNDREKAPWADFEGTPLYEGDTIMHPVSGKTGVIIYLADEPYFLDQWAVRYKSGKSEKLNLLIGSKIRPTKVDK